jgi:L-iditol 2-dehydrogenase
MPIPDMMKAAVVTGPQQFDLQDLPVPEVGPDDVLIRVRNCGICGSDLHFFRGEFPAAEGMRLGHEIAGEVAAFGANVAGLSEGQLVAIEPVDSCRRCDLCMTGRYQLCPDRQLMGSTIPGAFAEYLLVPSYLAHLLPAGVDTEIGALVEPLAVTVHGLRQVRLEAGERVAIIGAGTIGLVAAVSARAMGASEVFISARYPHQAEAARRIGAQPVDADDNAMKNFAAVFAGRPPDVVVETVGGHHDTLNDAVRLVAPGGRISVLGIFTKPVSLNATAAVLKEALLVGGMTYGRPGNRSDFEVALDIAANHADKLRSLITHRVPLAEIARGFEIAADKAQESIKVTVEVG